MRLILLLLSANVGLAQELPYDSTIVEFPDEDAQFIDGLGAFKNYIRENIEYPNSEYVYGIVYVQFVVELDSTISNVFVSQGVMEFLDLEAVRLIKGMPKMKPGISNGIPVRTSCVLPVKFALWEEEIIENPDQEAQFPGAAAAEKYFIHRNMEYPEEAIEHTVQGTVKMEFVVEKDGTISNIAVTNDISELLQKEAIRLVNIMPKWKPAKHKGKLVRSRVEFPISFRLD